MATKSSLKKQHTEPEPGFDSRPKCIFRRELPIPPALASFYSERGQEIFTRALNKGTMKCYFGLAQQFRTQNEPSFCGISTLVMCLNAFQMDPHKIWKGAWRFYHEDMLDCCTPLEEVMKVGISLGPWMCLARCNGASVVGFAEGGGESLESFRQVVKQCSMVAADKRALVLSYSRKEFNQTGDGHFSCCGGYDEEEDAVLVLDVARFKYPAHWVKVEAMFRAMKRLDPDTNKPRGYVILEPSSLGGTFVFTLRARIGDWIVFNEFCSDLGKRLSDTKGASLCERDNCSPPTDLSDVIKVKAYSVWCFFKCLPEKVSNSLSMFESEYFYEFLDFRPRDHELRMAKMKEEIEQLPIYALVNEQLEKLGKKGQNPTLSCVLFLAFPEPCRFFVGSEVTYKELQDISGCSELLQTEITTLQRQIRMIMEASAKPSADKLEEGRSTGTPGCGAKGSCPCAT